MKWVRPALFVVGVLAAIWILRSLSDVAAPFAFAFAVAYVLAPAAAALERTFGALPLLRRHARAAAVSSLLFVLLGSLLVILLVVVPKAVEQVRDAASRFPDWMTTLRQRVEPMVEALRISHPEQFEEARAKLVEAVKGNLPHLFSPMGRIVQAAFSSALGVVLFVLHVVTVPVFAVYLLFDMEKIHLGARELVPHRYRDYVYSRVSAVERLLAAFVRGQLTVCLILGCFYAISLTILGVPMGVLVGFVVALFNLIPYMSTVLGLPLVLLLSFLDKHSPEAALEVLGAFLLGHVLEGHFLTPRIMGNQLGLHPVVVMLAVLVGGSLFGFIGMLLAVPTTAALSVFWADLEALYLRSHFFRDEGGEPKEP